VNNPKNKKLPTFCPSCDSQLQVSRLSCAECNSIVEGQFELPILARLDKDEQELVIALVKTGGSLKDVAKAYNLSYPTVRNKIDSLMETIKRLEASGLPSSDNDQKEKP